MRKQNTSGPVKRVRVSIHADDVEFWVPVDAGWEWIGPALVERLMGLPAGKWHQQENREVHSLRLVEADA